MSGFDIIDFLKKANATKASDIHLRVGERPILRKNGSIIKVDMPRLTRQDFDTMFNTILPKEYLEKIEKVKDLDFSFEIPSVARFRVNVNVALGEFGMVLRIIPSKVKKLTEIGVPLIIEDFAKLENGLVLVTGPTGSGKSTTLSALLDYINENYQKHILTLEDPIEFVFENKKSVVTQRQINLDTENFNDGIKYALRQDPDVILVGEIRDIDTVTNAMKAAETGHLVFGTLHTNGAVQTVARIVNMFDTKDRENVRGQLAKLLRGTIAQKLVVTKDGQGRCPACEVLKVGETVRDFIEKDQLEEIFDLVAKGSSRDFITLNISLFDLVKAGKISQEVALQASDNQNELSRMFKGAAS